MKKSSQRKESKYLSIVVIPHNTDEIKVFKISSVKYKLMALGAILLTMFICSGILKKVIAVNNQQMNLITEREEIIQSYIRKVEEQDKLIKNFTTLYRDMTAKYIDGSMENVTASRSGLRDDRAFINDINKLKF